jgi:TetR/AcrR family transcriptional repressor of nem operon
MATSSRRRGPGSRADESHPTRHDLLRAAGTVVDRDGLAALSIDAVTSEAGLAKGTFYIHFADRSALLVELHRRFHDDLFEMIDRKTSALQPGPERARVRMAAFLDGCRRQAGVRAMLLQARSEPAVLLEVDRRNEEAARLLAADLRGVATHPAETAHLLVAATAEVALRELRAGRTLPRLRASLTAIIPA